MNEVPITIANAPKSIFVTVLAWFAIVLGGFCTTISILQNVMIFVMFKGEEVGKDIHDAKQYGDMPWFFKWFMLHPQSIFLATLALFSVAFISGIGLLKRKNWARLIFICMSCLGIIWNVLSLVMQSSIISTFKESSSNVHDSNFRMMAMVIQIFSVLFAIGFSLLFLWIIRMLTTERIRREFNKET